MTVMVSLEREDEEAVGPVDAPFFPKAKDEGWWLVLGDLEKDELASIKRVSLGVKQNVKVCFVRRVRCCWLRLWACVASGQLVGVGMKRVL